MKIATKSASDIAANVQHPVFNANDGRLYMMSIPFDMSAEAAGKELVLPACTRFKVWLYDVNNGDRNTTGSTGSESNYHIFVLSDIKDKNGEALFKDGLTLKAGYSYLFSVGYHYNKLTITAEDDFSWEEQDLGSQEAHDEAVQQDNLDFSWWTGAYIRAAVDALYNGKDFLPEFSIADQKQFLSFIKLVNGTAATRMSGLKRGEVRKDENGQDIKDENGFETYWWILEDETDENGQPKQITMEEAVKLEKGKVERQQKAQAVKLQYIDEFAKVLEADQLVRLYSVENQIQQKLHSRQQGRGGQGMRGGRPNGPRPGNRPGGSGPEDGE